MKVNNSENPTNKSLPKLKVIQKSSGKFEVHFPFSEIPVEMTKNYFESNVNVDHYVLDFIDE
jgi:hypothetical protein